MCLILVCNLGGWRGRRSTRVDIIYQAKMLAPSKKKNVDQPDTKFWHRNCSDSTRVLYNI